MSNKKAALEQRIHFIKNQNFFCDERNNSAQKSFAQQEISKNIYYQLDQMRQNDYLSRERSTSDYDQTKNQSSINHSNYLKFYNSTQTSQMSLKKQKQNKNKLQLANSYYFTTGVITPLQAVPSGSLTSKVMTDSRHSQNNILRASNQEGQLSESQQLTPRMQFYLTQRPLLDILKNTKESDTQGSNTTISLATTPRQSYNYKGLFMQQSPLLTPKQVIVQPLNQNNLENDLISLNRFKKVDSLYEENLDKEARHQRQPSFLNDLSIPTSDLVLEDASRNQSSLFRSSTPPSFLNQKHEGINPDSINLDNSQKIEDNLINDTDNEQKGISDQQLMMENPNMFFQKLGIKTLQISKTKKKSLHQILEDSIESELKIMKEFDQKQILDDKLNQKHYDNFMTNSSELLDETYSPLKIDTEKLRLECNKMSTFANDSPRKSPKKNIKTIIEKSVSNPIKQQIKLNQQDMTISYLLENSEQLKLDFSKEDEKDNNLKKDMRSLLLKNKDQLIFKSADNFQKVTQFQKIQKLQEIIRLSQESQKKLKVNFCLDGEKDNFTQSITRQNIRQNLVPQQATIQVLSSKQSIQSGLTQTEIQNQLHNISNIKNSPLPSPNGRNLQHQNSLSSRLICTSDVSIQQNQSNKQVLNQKSPNQQFKQFIVKLESKKYSPISIKNANNSSKNQQQISNNQLNISNFSQYNNKLNSQSSKCLITQANNSQKQIQLNSQNHQLLRADSNKQLQQSSSQSNLHSNRAFTPSNSEREQKSLIRPYSSQNKEKRQSLNKLSQNKYLQLNQRRQFQNNFTRRNSSTSSQVNKEKSKVQHQYKVQFQEQKVVNQNQSIKSISSKNNLNSQADIKQEEESQQLIRNSFQTINKIPKHQFDASRLILRVEGESKDSINSDIKFKNLINKNELKQLLQKKQKLTQIFKQRQGNNTSSNVSGKIQNNNISDRGFQNLSNFAQIQSTKLVKEEEKEMLNTSFVQTKQDVKQELNSVEKEISKQSHLIENIKLKKGEYISPFRERPSNQFIYEHIFYSKFNQLRHSIKQKIGDFDTEPY